VTRSAGPATSITLPTTATLRTQLACTSSRLRCRARIVAPTTVSNPAPGEQARRDRHRGAYAAACRRSYRWHRGSNGPLHHSQPGCTSQCEDTRSTTASSQSSSSWASPRQHMNSPNDPTYAYHAQKYGDDFIPQFTAAKDAGELLRAHVQANRPQWTIAVSCPTTPSRHPTVPRSTTRHTGHAGPPTGPAVESRVEQGLPRHVADTARPDRDGWGSGGDPRHDQPAGTLGFSRSTGAAEPPSAPTPVGGHVDERWTTVHPRGITVDALWTSC
jgi:hypothetical protein